MDKYEANRFDDCLINPFNDMDTPIAEQFPKYKKHFTGSKIVQGMSIDTLIRYIVCVYDPNSPFRIDYLGIEERKVKAGEALGLPQTKDGERFLPQILSLFQCKNIEATRMILRYVRLLHNPIYAQLVSFQEAFYDLLLRIASNTSKDKKNTEEDIKASTAKAELTKKVEELGTRIHAHQITLLADDRNVGLIDELYSIPDYDDSELNIMPETYEGPEKPVPIEIQKSG